MKDKKEEKVLPDAAEEEISVSVSTVEAESSIPAATVQEKVIPPADYSGVDLVDIMAHKDEENIKGELARELNGIFTDLVSGKVSKEDSKELLLAVQETFTVKAETDSVIHQRWVANAVNLMLKAL